MTPEIENKEAISEEALEPYGDILEILKADRPPRNYKEAIEVAFEVEQLTGFMQDIAFLLSDEEGAPGSYLYPHKNGRAFRVMGEIFGIIGVLSGNLKDWAEIEINKYIFKGACDAKRNQKNQG